MISEPLVGRTDVMNFQDTYAQALLRLDRLDEAKPLVQVLLTKGWRDPSFLRVVREAGLGDLMPTP